MKNPADLHDWPQGIVGVVIDAREVTDSKINPFIDFEYEEGFNPPAMTATITRTPIPQLRSIATGGTAAALPAPKRQRHGTETRPNTAAYNAEQRMANEETAKNTAAPATQNNATV